MDIRKYLVRIDSNGQRTPLQYERDATSTDITPRRRPRRSHHSGHGSGCTSGADSGGERRAGLGSNRKAPYARPKRPLIESGKQYILDLGQKDIGARECSVCKMLYERADVTDEKHHQAHHDAYVNGIRLNEWKFERILMYMDDGARVSCVLPSDPKHMRNKVDELLRLSDRELGIGVPLDQMSRDFMYLMYVTSRRRVAGFVVGERIRQAARLVCEDPLSVSTDLETAEVGVSRLWVHHSYRGQGIATVLVDVLRANLYRERIVARRHVAFSDPTTNGKDFAKKFTDDQHFLVYAFAT
jgi:N-acetyltransferase